MLPDTISTLAIEAAAPLDVDAAGCDVVGDEVLCNEEEDGVCDADDEDPLSTEVSVLSLANWAETPEELVQMDGGVPFPATKFTDIH